MTLSEYKKTSPIIKKGCVGFLLHEENILLSMKKRGYGMGKWNGYGGKCEEGETIRDAAIREAREEIGVEPKSLKQVATLRFFTPEAEVNWEIGVFLVTKWDGLPDESDEVRPEWFSLNDIPYDEMWPDDKFWLPRVLNGEKLEGDFLFDKDDNLVEQSIITK